MQSYQQLNIAAAAFTIPIKEVVPSADKLNTAFRIRNQIVHEMDIDFNRVNRSRRTRTQTTMKESTEELFHVASRFLKKADDLLNAVSTVSPT